MERNRYNICCNQCDQVWEIRDNASGKSTVVFTGTLYEVEDKFKEYSGIKMNEYSYRAVIK